jgi:hypothetical protein
MRRAGARSTIAGVLSVVVLGAQMGCSGPRGGSSLHSLTSQVNSCAVTLPLARTTVSQRGRLVTIHPLRHGQADRIARTVEGLLSKRPSGSPTVAPPATTRATHAPPLSAVACVVVYRGPYRRGDVAGAEQQRGRYALLIVRVRHPAVLRVFLVDQLPHGL